MSGKIIYKINKKERRSPCESKGNGGAVLTYFKILSVIFGMRFEYQRHDKGKDDGCRNAGARCRQRARKRLKQSLLRAAHRAVRKQIPESRNGHGCASTRKFHKRLI